MGGGGGQGCGFFVEQGQEGFGFVVVEVVVGLFVGEEDDEGECQVEVDDEGEWDDVYIRVVDKVGIEKQEMWCVQDQFVNGGLEGLRLCGGNCMGCRGVVECGLLVVL